jgi:hypothetical protein
MPSLSPAKTIRSLSGDQSLAKYASSWLPSVRISPPAEGNTTCVEPKPHCGLIRNTFTNLFIGGSLMIAAAITPGNARSHAQSQPPADGSVKMCILSGRPVVDGVYLSGRGPFRFLADTGAQTNQLEASLAEKIGLKSAFRTEIATVTGNALVPGGRVAEVTFGPATASNQEFLFTGLDGVHRLSLGIQGIIGEEFLSHFDYLLDFAGRRIMFGDVEPGGGSRTRLYAVDGPAVETDKGRMVLDSGAVTAILYATSIERSGTRVVTASGSAPVSEPRELRFRVAGHAYSTAAVAVPRVSTQEDGILPASLFHSVYVSNSGRFLILDPIGPFGR